MVSQSWLVGAVVSHALAGILLVDCVSQVGLLVAANEVQAFSIVGF